MAKKPAVQKTPEQEIPDGETIVGTGNEARLKMMAEINDRNDKQLAEEGDLRAINDDGTTADFDVSANEEEKTDDEIIEEEIARAETEANPVTEEETGEAESDDKQGPVEKHKIKVNGKELELTTRELIDRAQKVEAADEYLKEAAKKLRETSEKSIPATQQPSDEDAAAKALEEKRRAVRAIQMGSEEEAMAALDQLTRTAHPSLKEDDVSRVVEQRMAFNTAYEKFQQQYPEIVSDPILWDVASRMDAELMRSGDTRGYWTRYQEIGNQIRSWRENLVKTASTRKEEPATPAASEKQQRKASTPAVPKGAGTKAPAAADEEDREESPSEIIAAMAKARGGPQWLRG